MRRRRRTAASTGCCRSDSTLDRPAFEADIARRPPGAAKSHKLTLENLDDKVVARAIVGRRANL